MSYAPYYLVTPWERESRNAAESREIKIQTRSADSDQDRPMNWVRRAWRFVADRPLA